MKNMTEQDLLLPPTPLLYTVPRSFVSFRLQPSLPQNSMKFSRNVFGFPTDSRKTIDTIDEMQNAANVL